MGKWLDNFLSRTPGAPPNKPDTLPIALGTSGTHPAYSGEIDPETVHTFQERAAVREFDGGQPRVEAELAALEEVMPFLEQINGQERLVIDSHRAPLKYRWWQSGQSVEATLRELGASKATISRYVSQLGGYEYYE